MERWTGSSPRPRERSKSPWRRPGRESPRRSESCPGSVASRPQRSRATAVSRSPGPSTARGTSDLRSSRLPKPAAGPCTSCTGRPAPSRTCSTSSRRGEPDDAGDVDHCPARAEGAVRPAHGVHPAGRLHRRERLPLFSSVGPLRRRVAAPDVRLPAVGAAVSRPGGDDARPRRGCTLGHARGRAGAADQRAGAAARQVCRPGALPMARPRHHAHHPARPRAGHRTPGGDPDRAVCRCGAVALRPGRRRRLGTASLAVGVIVVNLVRRHSGGRIDLTPGNSFTLSHATRQVLGTLPDLVTVKLFASAALPPEVAFLKRDVDDILDDYRSAGRGKLKLVIADPAADSAALREARTLGIPPVQFNVLGQAELQVKEGYLGLAVRYADGVRTMPFLQQTNDLEYRLTSDIRALTHPEKTVIAFGEIGDAASARSQRSFDALRERLGSHYDVRPFGLADTTIAPGVRVIAVAGPPDLLTTAQLTRLRAYLGVGGSLLLMAGGMQLQISQQGPPFAVSRRVGWNDLLKPYRVAIASDMVYDLASNVQVGTTAQFGQVLAPYPFWLRALSTKASPVNADLEAVLLPWASRIDTVHTPSIGVTPLFVTSRAGGVQETTVFLDPTRTFSRDSLRRRVVALLASPVRPDTAKGAPRGRVVVVGTGDFASDRYARNSPENLVFVENAVDWLAQDDALIAIRSKNRAPPPLVFTSAATRRAVKYGNVFGVPLLLVVAGVLRLWRRRQTTRRTYQPLAASSAA